MTCTLNPFFFVYPYEIPRLIQLFAFALTRIGCISLGFPCSATLPACAPAVQQVAFADKILLNKTDLVEDKDKQAVCSRIRNINAAAEIIECQYSKYGIESLRVSVSIY